MAGQPLVDGQGLRARSDAAPAESLVAKRRGSPFTMLEVSLSSGVWSSASFDDRIPKRLDMSVVAL